jgi:hypothetical protein
VFPPKEISQLKTLYDQAQDADLHRDIIWLSYNTEGEIIRSDKLCTAGHNSCDASSFTDKHGEQQKGFVINDQQYPLPKEQYPPSQEDCQGLIVACDRIFLNHSAPQQQASVATNPFSLSGKNSGAKKDTEAGQKKCVMN